MLFFLRGGCVAIAVVIAVNAAAILLLVTARQWSKLAGQSVLIRFLYQLCLSCFCYFVAFAAFIVAVGFACYT